MHAGTMAEYPEKIAQFRSVDPEILIFKCGMKNQPIFPNFLARLYIYVVRPGIDRRFFITHSIKEAGK